MKIWSSTSTNKQEWEFGKIIKLTKKIEASTTGV